MAPLNKYKQEYVTVDSFRCVVVEKNVTEERKEFLKALLEVNHFDVKIEKEPKETPEAPDTYIIGVTDVTFNPIISIYEGSLKTSKNRIVSPAYWLQETTVSDSRYWNIRKKTLKSKI